MFYSRMKEYPLQQYTLVDDGFGYTKEQYTDAGTVFAYIVRTDLTTYAANDLDLLKYQYTGYTDSDKVKVGSKIGDYKVSEVIPHKLGYALYLSSLGGKHE